MWVILSLLFSVAALTSTATSNAAQPSTPATQTVAHRFSALLQNNPFGLKDLLGKRAAEIVPGYSNWDDAQKIYIAEEYRDPEVKYDAFGGLSSYAKEWNFLMGHPCVSGYSLAVLFFNHGYLFRIELRFMSSKSYPSYAPICYDHTPIFESIAQKIDGVEETAPDGGRVIAKLEGDTITILHTKDGTTELDWILRGGPGGIPYQGSAT